MVGRDTPALRGGGFELLSGYNWIKKGGGGCCVAPGLQGRGNQGCSWFQCYLMPVAVGRGQFCSCFQSFPVLGTISEE